MLAYGLASSAHRQGPDGSRQPWQAVAGERQRLQRRQLPDGVWQRCQHITMQPEALQLQGTAMRATSCSQRIRILSGQCRCLCGWMQQCTAAHGEVCARPHLELGELPELLRHRLEQVAGQLQLLQRRQASNARWQVCEVVARQGQLLQCCSTCIFGYSDSVRAGQCSMRTDLPLNEAHGWSLSARSQPAATPCRAGWSHPQRHAHSRSRLLLTSRLVMSKASGGTSSRSHSLRSRVSRSAAMPSFTLTLASAAAITRLRLSVCWPVCCAERQEGGLRCTFGRKHCCGPGRQHGICGMIGTSVAEAVAADCILVQAKV
jgi:hypothetical protein